MSPSKVAKRKPETTARDLDAHFRAYMYRCPDVSLVPTQLVFSPGSAGGAPEMQEEFDDDVMSTPPSKRSRND
jgi:hypothetical protein